MGIWIAEFIVYQANQFNFKSECSREFLQDFILGGDTKQWWFERLSKQEYAELIKEGTDGSRRQILHQSSQKEYD